jgi:hypothetical protein
VAPSAPHADCLSRCIDLQQLRQARGARRHRTIPGFGGDDGASSRTRRLRIDRLLVGELLEASNYFAQRHDRILAASTSTGPVCGNVTRAPPPTLTAVARSACHFRLRLAAPNARNSSAGTRPRLGRSRGRHKAGFSAWPSVRECQSSGCASLNDIAGGPASSILSRWACSRVRASRVERRLINCEPPGR